MLGHVRTMTVRDTVFVWRPWGPMCANVIRDFLARIVKSEWKVRLQMSEEMILIIQPNSLTDYVR